MAKLYYTVYKGIARDPANAPVPAPEMPPLYEGFVEIGLDSVQSLPFPMHAKFISVTPYADCCIAVGRDPTADVRFHPITERETRWYGIYEGHRIAVIAGPAT